jgi:hypothetical protein
MMNPMMANYQQMPGMMPGMQQTMMGKGFGVPG